MKIAVDKNKNWVFVTGKIRGGTTFVGKMLSISKEVDYIHEPFNVGCGMPGMKQRWQYVTPGLDTPEMQELHRAASRLFTYDFSLRNSSFKRDPLGRQLIKSVLGSRGPFHLRLAKLNPFHRHAVIKDPTATLLTEYLYVHFGVKPVIVVRHPTAFIGSLKRVGWWPSVAKVLRQHRLVEDHFATEQEFCHMDWEGPVEQAAAHWRLINKVILEQRKRYPAWQVVRLEDLSRNPIASFKRLYEDLSLPWSAAIGRRIKKWTQAWGKSEPKGNRVQDLRRDSAKIFKLRRDALSPEERRKVFEITRDVALEYYTEESFDL